MRFLVSCLALAAGSCLAVFSESGPEDGRDLDRRTLAIVPVSAASGALEIPGLPVAPPGASDNLDYLTSSDSAAVFEVLEQSQALGLMTRTDWQTALATSSLSIAEEPLSDDAFAAAVKDDFETGAVSMPPNDTATMLLREQASADGFRAELQAALPGLSTDDLLAMRRNMIVGLAMAEMARLNNDPENGMPEELLTLSQTTLEACRRHINAELRDRGITRVE